eukprot:jgi/Galph1/1148/GphlegSOOS_G5859.1
MQNALENLQLQECIGSGSFGEVYKAFHLKIRKKVAVKLIDLEEAEGDLEDVRREIQILSQLRSPYIVTYYSSFTCESTLWIVMEYLEGGSLRDLIDSKGPNIPERSIALFLKDILQGLKYLHSEKRIHRDIKAANVLLSKGGRAKLVDFGVSQQLSRTIQKRNTFVGTPYWMAPEADIWSLGITALELAQGKPPWYHLHPMKALFVISEGNAPSLEGNYSSELKDFVNCCLQKEPERRWNAARLLQHDVFKNVASYNHVISLLGNVRSEHRPLNKALRHGKNLIKERVLKKIQAFHWTFGTVVRVAPNDNLVSCTVHLPTGGEREFYLYSKDKEDTASKLRGRKGKLIIRNGTSLDSLQFESGTVLRIVSSKIYTRQDVTVIQHPSATMPTKEQTGTVIKKNSDGNITSSTNVESKTPGRYPKKTLQSNTIHRRSLSDPSSDLQDIGTVLLKDGGKQENTSDNSHALSSASEWKYLTRPSFLASWNNNNSNNNNFMRREERQMTSQLPGREFNTVHSRHRKISQDDRTVQDVRLAQGTQIISGDDKHIQSTEEEISATEKSLISWNSVERQLLDSVNSENNGEMNTVIYRDALTDKETNRRNSGLGRRTQINDLSDTMSMDRRNIRKDPVDPYIEFGSREFSQTVSETVLPKRLHALELEDNEELRKTLKWKEVSSLAFETEKEHPESNELVTRLIDSENSQISRNIPSLLSSQLEDASPVLVNIVIPVLRKMEQNTSTLDDTDMQEIKLLSELATTLKKLDEIRPGILIVLFRHIFEEFASCHDDGLRWLFYSSLQKEK